MKLLNEVIGARFPHDVLDLVLAVGAQVFSKAVPVKTREASPEMTTHPIFCGLNFLSADYAGVHFQLLFHGWVLSQLKLFYCADRAIALLAVRMT
jgi:hypothetical protein